MGTNEIVALLASLAHPVRLSIFRMLVEAGEDGVAAGAIAEYLGVPNQTLSFHLKELAHAGMVRSRPEGRYVIYSAAYETMSELIAFLSANCCDGKPCAVTPVVKSTKPRSKSAAVRRH